MIIPLYNPSELRSFRIRRLKKDLSELYNKVYNEMNIDAVKEYAEKHNELNTLQVQRIEGLANSLKPY